VATHSVTAVAGENLSRMPYTLRAASEVVTLRAWASAPSLPPGGLGTTAAARAASWPGAGKRFSSDGRLRWWVNAGVA